MDDWEIVSRELEPVEAIPNALVGGPEVYIYTVRHTESGDTRKVIATDEDSLGEKIANGEFYD